MGFKLGLLEPDNRHDHECYFCGDTSGSVKYFAENKQNPMFYVCNKCALKYCDKSDNKISTKPVPFAVRLYKTSDSRHDVAEFRYMGGTSKRINLTVEGYECLKEVNGYTLFYEEREYSIISDNFSDYVVAIEYGENYSPIATIISPDAPRKTFRFNYVDEFNKYFVDELIEYIDSLPDSEKKSIYFMDMRERKSFDDFTC